MADDITLTVRVRDMTRGDMSRIQQQMRRLQRDANGASQSTGQVSRSTRAMRRDLDGLSQSMRNVLRTGNLTRREFQRMNAVLTQTSAGIRNARRAGEISRDTYRSMNHDVRQLRSQLVLLDADAGRIARVGARMRLLQGRMRDTSRTATGMRREFSRIGDFGLRGILGAGAAVRLLTTRLYSLVTVIKLSRRWLAILAAVMLLLGPAAQALAVLLTAVLGGAFIALGAFALKGNEQVKEAFRDMKNTVVTVVREAAAPMADDLARGMRQVGSAAQEMQPLLTQAFAASGPLIDEMFGGITDLFSAALPGFVAALQNSEGAMRGFRTAMGLIGKGFGDMMRIMTSGDQDVLEEAWITLGDEMRNLLENLGQFMSSALKSETATLLLVGVFRTLGGALNLVSGLLQTVDSVLGGLFKKVTGATTGMDDLKGSVDGIGSAFKSTGMSVDKARERLAEVDKALKTIKESVANFGPAGELIEVDGKTSKELERERESLLAVIEASEAAAAATLGEVDANRQLYDSVLKLNEAHRSAIDARANLEKAFDDGTEAAHEFKGALRVVGGEFDLSNEKARGAWDMLSKVADATNRSTQEAIAANEPWSVVAGRFEDGRAKLLALAESLGISAEGVDILTEKILDTPDKEARLTADKTDLENKLKVAKQKLLTLPDSKKAKARADISQLEQAIGEAKRLLASLDGRVAHTYVYENHIVTSSTGEAKSRKKLRAGSYAQGGAVGSAAVGGPRGRMTLVGEHGPELVDLAPGSRVRSNPDTERVAAFGAIGGGSSGFGGGGGGQSGPIVIHLSISDKYLGEIMVDPIRKAVRTRGGNVQAVLGVKGK